MTTRFRPAGATPATRTDPYPEFPDLLTTRQAAELLGLRDIRTIRRYIRNGHLDGAPLPGRQWRVSLESVHALLAAQPRRIRPTARVTATAADVEATIQRLRRKQAS